MSTAIEVQNLKKTFIEGIKTRRYILHEISFKVPEKTITGFVGANGSGKTTTIKNILEFVFPDKKSNSSIQYFGQRGLTPELRARIGYLPERPYLPESLTAREFLRLHWNLLPEKQQGGRVFDQVLEETLARVDLKKVQDKMLRTFSKGMLQRVGLGQALLGKPDLLILDEPMSGLDPDGRWLVKKIIREEHERGATIFFSSHLLADMDELCSYLVVIDGGDILFNGAVEDFVKQGIELHKNIEHAFALRLRAHRGTK